MESVVRWDPLAAALSQASRSVPGPHHRSFFNRPGLRTRIGGPTSRYLLIAANKCPLTRATSRRSPCWACSDCGSSWPPAWQRRCRGPGELVTYGSRFRAQAERGSKAAVPSAAAPAWLSAIPAPGKTACSRSEKSYQADDGPGQADASEPGEKRHRDATARKTRAQSALSPWPTPSESENPWHEPWSDRVPRCICRQPAGTGRTPERLEQSCDQDGLVGHRAPTAEADRPAPEPRNCSSAGAKSFELSPCGRAAAAPR